MIETEEYRDSLARCEDCWLYTKELADYDGNGVLRCEHCQRERLAAARAVMIDTRGREDPCDKVREAQTFLMGTVRPVRVTLKGSAIPEALSYLHALAAKGLADSYNLYDNRVVLRVVLADKQRYPLLQEAECVMLEYVRSV